MEELVRYLQARILTQVIRYVSAIDPVALQALVLAGKLSAEELASFMVPPTGISMSTKIIRLDLEHERRLHWLQQTLQLPSKKATAAICIDQVFRFVQKHLPPPDQFPQRPRQSINLPRGCAFVYLP